MSGPRRSAEPAPATRLVAVLGYSDRRTQGLHPVCAARLERAAAEAESASVVVLSGSARGRERVPEAELMRRAWRGPEATVLSDPRARTTAGNAASVAAIAERIEASEVVVVTSGWHAPRARALFRAQLRGSGIRLSFAPAAGPRPLRALVGEAVRWPLVVPQIALAWSRVSTRSEAEEARGT
jgi:uncharacterized SAM-binding protein YcdF (DUF218 family)